MIREKTLIIAQAVKDKKAHKVVVLNVRGLTNLCHFFIICSADNSKQVRALYEYILDKSNELKIKIHHCEEDKENKWLLVDFYDVILHIFLDETRSYYNLEGLWAQAKRVRLSSYKNKR